MNNTIITIFNNMSGKGKLLTARKKLIKKPKRKKIQDTA